MHNLFIEPGPAGAVEEHWTTEREDPDYTPDEGSEFFQREATKKLTSFFFKGY